MCIAPSSPRARGKGSTLIDRAWAVTAVGWNSPDLHHTHGSSISRRLGLRVLGSGKEKKPMKVDGDSYRKDDVCRSVLYFCPFWISLSLQPSQTYTHTWKPICTITYEESSFDRFLSATAVCTVIINLWYSIYFLTFFIILWSPPVC